VPLITGIRPVSHRAHTLAACVSADYCQFLHMTYCFTRGRFPAYFRDVGDPVVFVGFQLRSDVSEDMIVSRTWIVRKFACLCTSDLYGTRCLPTCLEYIGINREVRSKDFHFCASLLTGGASENFAYVGLYKIMLYCPSHFKVNQGQHAMYI